MCYMSYFGLLGTQIFDKNKTTYILSTCCHALILGFELFLQSATEQELTELPRGVGCTVSVKPIGSFYNQIPELLQSQYKTSKRPGVLPGIAGNKIVYFLSRRVCIF